MRVFCVSLASMLLLSAQQARAFLVLSA